MTTNQVDRAIAAPPADRARLLLEAHEDQWYDRKSARIEASKLSHALVAFANAEGGVVAVGLADGELEGFAEENLRHFQQIPMDLTRPPVRARFSLLDCVQQGGNTAQLLIIRVDPGERVHETSSGDCYLRIGDETRKLRFEQRQELEYDRGQAQYDGGPVEATHADLDGHLIETYKRAAGAVAPTEMLLRARALLTTQGRLTNAALLLFGSRPQQWFPQAYVRIIRYLGTDRGTGARLTLEDSSEHRVEGPIPRVIEDAQRIVESLMPRRRFLSADGRFETQPIVPRDAWLEGLVNAVIHRSYSLGGDHIRVEIYDDRVEIESPGRFPGLADPRKPLDISRFARNPRIARVCAELRIGQELGEGIRRMFDEMRSRGLTDPMYEEKRGSTRLVLSNMPRLAPDVEARLPQGSERVLDAIRAAGDKLLGTGDVAEAVEMSRPAVKVRLDALRAEGLIKWIGKSPKDPRAHWVLNE
ncbi:ATP-binding protein [Georgenia satyanarayanai]|uniref:ATP-binding protein n=1 Tax=Georgenia satyanarayanai TaxID=860221 RepID=UPI001265A8EC|nr:ATP-binding protein [Georgenia satyanarayanai]